MGLISNGTTIFDAGSLAAGLGSSMTFIKKITASSSATISFVNGSSDVVLDNTYKEYLFTFNSIHAGTDDTGLTVGFRDGSTDYDAPKTSTFFRATHGEDGTSGGVAYVTGADIANGTGFQRLDNDFGADNDQSMSGYMHLFNPSSTTFVKHFMSRTSTSRPANRVNDIFMSGYCNTTTAIDAVQFKMNSGNIDAGDICLYGIS
tara:strand:- start:233 stop:844 length:612 start_codon:yes stop_codon:yes gene_type:complete